jgi:hypothetical protein
MIPLTTNVAPRTLMGTTARRRVAIGAALLLLPLSLAACDRPKAPAPAAPAASTQAPGPGPQASAPDRQTPAPDQSVEPSPSHDLSVDEAMGGHTLARHVARTDDQLRERLRREPDISSASTYIDRANAEAVVAAALSSPPRSFDGWRRRTGRRPNFVLHFDAHHVIGRSLTRGQSKAKPCEDALVVLRWDDRREQFYVLTSYPEARR